MFIVKNVGMSPDYGLFRKAWPSEYVALVNKNMQNKQECRAKTKTSASLSPIPNAAFWISDQYRTSETDGGISL